MKIKEEDKDLNYWKNNCEEDYLHTPISVLRYITKLEEAVNNGVLDDVSKQRELLKGFANRFNKSSETYILEGEINKFLKTFNCG
jgi:hypothetical protein